MKLYEYLNSIPSFEKIPVTLFISSVPTDLFFSVFVRTVQRASIKVIFVDAAERTVSDIETECAISFLGQSHCYWIENLSQLSPTLIKQWYSFFSQYKGPHTLFAVIPTNDEEIDQKECLCVELPSKVDYVLACLVGEKLFNISKERSALFLKKLYDSQGSWSFDEIVLFLQYMPIVSHQHLDVFTKEWTPHLINKELSLFTLSTHFFARNRDQFLPAWSQICHQYQPPFWTTFWSDQLWRAALFTGYAQVGNFVAAKKITHRLPFSFIKKDWKHYSFKELVDCQQKIYAIDYAFKNGGNTILLDQFCIDFVSRTSFTPLENAQQ